MELTNRITKHPTYYRLMSLYGDKTHIDRIELHIDNYFAAIKAGKTILV